MNVVQKLRRGEGPYWGALKRFIRSVLTLHVPAAGPARPVFSLLYGIHVTIREALIWACRFLWYEPLFRSQCEAVGQQFLMEQLPYLTGKGRIVIGDGVRFSGKPSIGFSNITQSQPVLQVGNGVFIGHNASFAIAQSVIVGDHTLIAGGVSVRDFDGHPIDPVERRSSPTPAEGIRSVVIGNDVWIGSGATILKGVTIGDRSIVATQAVVTKDVPQDSVVAGNPARVVRTIEPSAGSRAENDGVG